MNKIATVILDESCQSLEVAVRQFAPTQIFRRRAGFRSSPELAAQELLAAFTQEEMRSPAIYVAPSFAAFTALVFAQRSPGFLSGILLLDPSHPDQGPAALSVLASPEVAPSAGVEKLRKLLSGFGPVWEDACQAVSGIHDLGDLPLVILAGGRFDLLEELPKTIQDRLIADRHQMLARYAKLSTRPKFRVIPKAGHDLVRDAPESVCDALRALLGTDVR